MGLSRVCLEVDPTRADEEVDDKEGEEQLMTKWRVWDHQDSVSLSLATVSPLQEPIYQVDIVTRCIDRCLVYS